MKFVTRIIIARAALFFFHSMSWMMRPKSFVFDRSIIVVIDCLRQAHWGTFSVLYVVLEVVSEYFFHFVICTPQWFDACNSSHQSREIAATPRWYLLFSISYKSLSDILFQFQRLVPILVEDLVHPAPTSLHIAVAITTSKQWTGWHKYDPHRSSFIISRTLVSSSSIRLKRCRT